MALFAVIAKRAPVGISIEEFQAKLAEGFRYTQELQEKGLIRDRWILVGASAGLNIYDVESHEQLMQLLYRSPAGLHLDFEVYPLISPPSYDPTAEGPAH
ncbi:muconolactone Delta-isomerase family protein [Streptomyces crystallinus]|uniref:Muconolactone isomerase domain-containing protein n=1 Tax=Streptomyces crystallinus TaxID=68191 RepID=A0ABN1G276_9ACTN